MSEKFSFDSAFPERELPEFSSGGESKPANPDQWQEIRREANSRLGDQFKELGKTDKAILYYKKAKDEAKLEQVRQEILQSGDLRMADYIAAHSNKPLSNNEYEKIADNAFKDKYKVEGGYNALERAGYEVRSAEPTKYSVFWKGAETDLDRQARRSFDLGKVHEKSSDWYEAVRRYEDVIDYANQTGNENLAHHARQCIISVGRKCVKSGSLYQAFTAFKVAKSQEDLEKLSHTALLASPRMENLALWINTEVLEIQAAKQESRQA